MMVAAPSAPCNGEVRVRKPVELWLASDMGPEPMRPMSRGVPGIFWPHGREGRVTLHNATGSPHSPFGRRISPKHSGLW